MWCVNKNWSMNPVLGMDFSAVQGAVLLLYLTDFLAVRYMDGERLTAEDEKAVVEKLLIYHPHSEDKIGCGLDCIMVSLLFA
ncbi:hypothetical protein CK203_024798 [Vitis vinifera]|uniref:Protein DCL, chloroplastic n=1 Tax=Vitis vinifera TaxID=29760 RepID=A0A438ITF3_VITVI|nr:hypothetical protein CK203_024798 [Vitis vinifera]